MAKEKSGETPLIEAKNEANNRLLASFSTKSSGISTIFTRHPTRARSQIIRTHYRSALSLRSPTNLVTLSFVPQHQSTVLSFTAFYSTYC